MTPHTLDPQRADLEAFVEAYEAAQEKEEPVDVSEYAPGPEHPHYLGILCELVRLDLEFGWRQRRPRRLEEYQRQFPRLFEDPQSLAAIAFEEYRLRRRAGQPTSLLDYERQFGVNTAGWPAADDKVTRRQGDQLAGRASDGAPPPSLARPANVFPEPGERFLDFQLVRELGRGAFGRVYLARQGDLANRLVVLKIGAALFNESQNLAQLLHSHIIPIYSVHRHGDLQALCMPFAGATTLADVLRDRFQRVGEPESLESTGAGVLGNLRMLQGMAYVNAILWIAARLADGLQHAHAHGILHRDLKPANILLTDEGQPMLLDFNLAEDIKLRLFSSADAVGGTVAYMAPEHLAALGGDSEGFIDVRSDIFSLGVILFELLTGAHPFPRHTGPLDQTLLAMIGDRFRTPPRLRRWNKAVSPAVEAIVRRCLEPHPADRYQSALELQDDVNRHLMLLPLRHCREPSRRERARKWLARHPRFLSGLGTAIFAILLLIIAWPQISEVLRQWWGQ